MDEKDLAVEAIRKKLVGKKLTYEEIYAVMDEIAHNRLGDVLTTYFAASGYAKGFSNEELYFLTKAMVETGEQIHWHSDMVADKHSIGGIPGTRTTLILVPIIAAAGFTIPKSSSRAITSPDGTADDMEVLSKVEFSREEIHKIVDKTHGCIVWGGSFHIAPADDLLIHVERELSFESYDKIIVSIMAKKVAFGSTHVVIDLPFGPTVKVHRRSDAEVLKEKFEFIAKKFNIKIAIHINEMQEPAGRGIGPVLETRDALMVLEQSTDRPIDLEEKALSLAGALLDLCLEDSNKTLQEKIHKQFTTGRQWARHILQSGEALQKMKEIVIAQGGESSFSARRLEVQLGRHCGQVVASKSGTVKEINSKNTTIIARLLGAPTQKGAGIWLDKKVGEKVTKGETLYTMYSETLYNLKEAKDSIKHFPVVVL